MCICGCEGVTCVQECVSVFAVEAEAPFAPTRPTALMCPPLAPMPRNPWREVCLPWAPSGCWAVAGK